MSEPVFFSLQLWRIVRHKIVGGLLISALHELCTLKKELGESRERKKRANLALESP